jgi:predicted dehydrogenase
MIGCGLMAQNVATRLLNDRPALALRGLYDPNPESVKATLEALRHPPAKVYRSYRQMLLDPAIEWVLIASWNCFHAEQTIAAFEAGKHVFCQKPLAITPEECIAMKKAWKRSGKRFFIGFNLRYSPFYRKIHELVVEQKTIGELVSFEFNETLGFGHGGFIMGDWRRLRRNAGTHLLEKCCHDLDLANWIVGSRARRVASFGGLDFFLPRNASHLRRGGRGTDGRWAYQGWVSPYAARNPFTGRKDVVDNQVAIIEYANGVRATFHTNLNAGLAERRFYLLGTEGSIRANLYGGPVELQRIQAKEKIELIEIPKRDGHAGGDEVLAEELAECIVAGTPPQAGFEEGLASALTCLAIDEAMDTGTVVDVGKYWRRAGMGQTCRQESGVEAVRRGQFRRATHADA